MIQLDNISLSYGSREIFKNLDWPIKDGKRIGLFGPNGVGKTTLLNIIAGLTHPDSGAVIVPPAVTVGYLPQEVGDSVPANTVIEEGMTAFRDIQELEREMESVRDDLGRVSGESSAERKRLLHRLDAVQSELNTRGFHTVRYRTE
ncbi:MAG: ATP-binding cassette domain-containing protein, partial [Candidatus Dadabacteria bacterium]|nr:ATP-binding cassette domain-containing protein [Candidatus Dadabacteria bacterium]